ncbi:hypothetical protein ACFXN8_02495, partial [Lysinibacillus sp. NPDC059133]
VKELYRKKASYIKEKHGALANKILSLGDEVYIETMHFKGLAKRTKETKTNIQGKIQSKKRFGKSIGNHAPAMLVEIIHQKLAYTKQTIQKVNTITFRASQYNHVTDSYEATHNVTEKFEKVSTDIFYYVQLGIIKPFDMVLYVKYLELFNKDCGYAFPTIYQLED